MDKESETAEDHQQSYHLSVKASVDVFDEIFLIQPLFKEDVSLIPQETQPGVTRINLICK